MGTTHLVPVYPARRRYEFAGFTLDLDGGFVRAAGGEQVDLRPKAFELLVYLVERPARLVGKDELVEALWPGVAVTDNSLAQCMAELRRALGDERREIIRTVARRGYVFAAPLVDASIPAPSPGRLETPPSAGRVRRRPRLTRTALLAAAAVAIIAAGMVGRQRVSSSETTALTPITDFTDAATAPAVSPDGRLVAFFRGDQFFTTRAPIWVKQLPDGEPVQLTDDPRAKLALAFSPDGSQVAYTALDGHWSTYVVPALGGEPRLLFPNASGLSWMPNGRLLFSTQRGSIHMGLVTTTTNRTDLRDVYWPAHQRGMVHFSYPSPDGRWALAVEMDYQPVWQRCRLVPLDGSSSGRPVGPDGQCTSGGWSPDGRWMYLNVTINGRGQLWRQRFPEGTPEPLTSGPGEAAGLAVTPDGSLITSLGVKREALWLLEPGGEQPVSTEGTVFSITRAFTTGNLQGWSAVPMFSRDGRYLYYLQRREPAERFTLRRTELASGRTEDVSGEFGVLEFDISDDGSLAVFSTGRDSDVELWVTPVDRSSAPMRIFRGAAAAPQFGAPGEVLFRLSDGRINRLYRMKLEGTELAPAVPYPIATLQSASPDGRWVAALLPDRAVTHLVPTDGGTPIPLCGSGCPTQWSPDGRYLYVSPRPDDANTMVALPVPPGESIPRLPPDGIRSAAHGRAIPGAVVIDKPEVTPGLAPTTYAYVKTTSQWNLYRLRLP